MTVIQVLEHQRLSIDSLGSDNCLSRANAIVLENLEKGLPKGFISWGRDSVKFSQHCGVLALGDTTIEVLPKIHGSEDDPGSSRQILVKMLYAAKRLKTPPSGSASIGLQKNYLLDVFISHFCEELFSQLREGMIRSYVVKEDNLPVLKGRLLLDQQLKLNSVHKEKMYCQYDELVEDNLFNQIIKYTLYYLNKISVSGGTKRKITELLLRFGSVSDRDVSLKDFKNIQLSRVTGRYEYVLEQCAWFISGFSQDVVSGSNSSLALLFDMNRLFEEVVSVKLKRLSWSKGYKMRTQGPQKYLLRDMSADRPLFMMKPDITLLKDDSVKTILDAKWKMLGSDESKYGISQSDLYQMVAYGTSYGCTSLALIYPKQSGINQSYITFLLDAQQLTISIVFVDVAKLTGSKLQVAQEYEQLFRVLADIK